MQCTATVHLKLWYIIFKIVLAEKYGMDILFSHLKLLTLYA